MDLTAIAASLGLQAPPSGQGREFQAWSLRSSTVGFAAGCRTLQQDVPRFGNLVKVCLQESLVVFGLIYDVQVKDDPAVRQLILVGNLEPELILDQQENRLVPIEISILTVGYQEADGPIFYGLPPQPPISLDMLTICGDDDLRAFTKKFDYFRLILNTPSIPTDELLVAHVHQAARTWAPEVRYGTLVWAGREAVRLLNHDLIRLESVVRKISEAAKP